MSFRVPCHVWASAWICACWPSREMIGHAMRIPPVFRRWQAPLRSRSRVAITPKRINALPAASPGATISTSLLGNRRFRNRGRQLITNASFRKAKVIAWRCVPWSISGSGLCTACGRVRPAIGLTPLRRPNSPMPGASLEFCLDTDECPLFSLPTRSKAVGHVRRQSKAVPLLLI